jgi:hypothetical protein
VAWISWQPGRAAGVACAAAAAAAASARPWSGRPAWHCRAARRGAYMHAPSYEPAGYVLIRVIQSYEREREGHTSHTEVLQQSRRTAICKLPMQLPM